MEIRNKIKSENKNKFSFGGGRRQWFILAAVFFALIFGLVGVGVWLQTAYEQKIYPGVHVDSFDLSGLSKEQAVEKLNTIQETLQTNGIKFKAQDKEITITPILISSSPDLVRSLVMIDPQKTMETAYEVGRNQNFFFNSVARLSAAVLGVKINLVYQVDQAELVNHLKTNFAELEKLPVNAKLLVKNNQAEVQGEQSGYIFDYQAAAVELDKNIKNLDFDRPINLELAFAEPEIKKQFTGSVVNSLEKILDLPEFKLVFEDESWVIPKAELLAWLEFQKIDNDVVIGVNQDSAVEFLQAIAKDIDVPTRDAKLQFAGDRIVEFQASQDGKAVNVEATYKIINEQVMLGNAAEIQLAVEVVPAKVATSDLNDLGIKELLGRGTSNFTGSPVNRRHNIGVGVDSLNGILIKPGEEFSLIDALGEIDGTTGYLQELVIKGDRTIPEYGGGLCQIGSTTFRAALWSGLPVVERRNHSYRVRYYEPAGMDATIYDPAPDMKFLNDTGHHILFIAKMSGDDLIFEFYGTDDGRKVTIEPNPPAIYNVVSPGEPRYIETEDLPPGEKKKVESAHPGADTYFKYSVEYPNGEIKEQEFYSHYVAWQETWLVGKDPTAASSTETLEPAFETPAN